MTDTTRRLFHRFRTHETITLVSSDGGRRITYLDEDGREQSLPVLAKLSIDLAAIPAGTVLQVQFGEVDNWTSGVMGGRRHYVHGGRSRVVHAYTGCRCISAIRLPDPRVQLPTVRMMEAAFGPEAAASHLRHFGEGGSTLQERIELPRERYSRWRRALPLDMRVEKGVLWAEATLAEGISLHGSRLQIANPGLPHAVQESLVGRLATDLVDLPQLRDPETVITDVVEITGGSQLNIFLETPLLTPAEAIARIAPPLAMAA